MPKREAPKGKKLEPVTRDETVHIRKMIHKVSFKKRAPKVVKRLRRKVQLQMGTKDVRFDTKLNKAIWACGIRHPPNRLRIRMSRKRNEDEDAKEKMYTLVQHVPVESFKGLKHEKVEEE
mmetsp:Transcript_1487/g.3015  ORF Transcript_1487/g.3015 Transcript_1487/m.3015 type:complete len:120 (+) Transcript_1487:93-452(+)